MRTVRISKSPLYKPAQPSSSLFSSLLSAHTCLFLRVPSPSKQARPFPLHPIDLAIMDLPSSVSLSSLLAAIPPQGSQQPLLPHEEGMIIRSTTECPIIFIAGIFRVIFG